MQKPPRIPINKNKPAPYTEPVSYLNPILKELRKSRYDQGWTQEALGREAGVTPRQIRKWENGIEQPQLSTLVGWARALGYRLKLEIIDENGSKSSDA